MAETTMASADLAPAERPMPVGYRFHPTDQELVGHYLRHKLNADDLSIHETIPEISVCKGEPWDLLEWATSASSAKFDESQCFFFSPRDNKYPNSNRSNRTTPRGSWKKTGDDCIIKCKITNKVIGTKKILVYREGRGRRATGRKWVIHEYHDAELSQNQRTHVLCWLREDNNKKTEEKTHQLERRKFDRRQGNQSNICTNSEEHYFSDAMIQVSSEPNEDSMNQISSRSNGIINPVQQIYPQSYESPSSMIGAPFELDEELASILYPPQLDEKLASILYTPLPESNSTFASENANPANVYPIPEYTVSHKEDSMMTQTTLGSTMEEPEEFDFRSFLRSSPSRDDE